MSSHAPDHKPIDCDFGSKPGETTGDGMFFGSRKKRADGMFYSAEGAAKSTAGQDTDVEAGGIADPRDELVDLHKEAYAQILLKEGSGRSHAAAALAGAGAGVVAGFVGGRRTAEGDTPEARREKIRQAREFYDERIAPSEAGQAVSSARDAIGHAGRAGADAVHVVAREIDKRASAEDFAALEKTAGFLSLPTKAGVGKAVLRGLGYGGLGVGAMGLAAGAGPGGTPMVDMQTGKVDVSQHPTLGPAAGRVGLLGSEPEAPATEATDPLREARKRRIQNDWSTGRKDLMAAKREHDTRNDPSKQIFGIDVPWSRTKGEVLDSKRRAEAVSDASRRGQADSVYSVMDDKGLSGFVGRTLGTAQGEFERLLGAGGAAGGVAPNKGGSPSAPPPRAAAEAGALAELTGKGGDPVLDALAQRRSESPDPSAPPPAAGGASPMERGPDGKYPIKLDTGGRTQGVQLADASQDPTLTVEPGVGLASAVGDPGFTVEPGVGLASAVGDPGFTVEPQRVAKKSPPAPKELAKAPASKQAKPLALADASAGTEVKPQLRDPSFTAQREDAGPAPRAETARGGASIGGPEAMVNVGTRPSTTPPGAPAKAPTDEVALAETRWGDEIDRQYPGLDPATRQQLLQIVAQQGGLPGDVGPGQARVSPGGASVANVSPGVSSTSRGGPRYDEMNPLVDFGIQNTIPGPGDMLAGK